MYQNTQSISKMRQETADLSDAHCHLNLFPDPKQTVSECAAHGMKVMLATGGSVKDNLQVSELTHAEIVFGIVGIGPDFVGEVGQVGIVANLVKRNRKIVGIGEI
ncbi:MAG: TatD family hydrolase, partial [Candidatus Micrarchaeota archaeon]|nr:TatD family hydrolase [Candidatus Micrarchaeota archaeon]